MKITRRTKLLIVALALCFTTMIGSTFAWFTDSAESAVNTIEAGNLDMVVEYKTSTDGEWKTLTEEIKLFKEDILWEPGHTEIVHFRVSNAGSLAFKYNFGVTVNSETTSTNVAGEEFSLKDYLEVGCYVMDESLGQYLLGSMFGTRESAIQHVNGVDGTGFKKLSALDGAICKDKPLSKTDVYCPQLVTLVLTMPETVGNEANHKTGVAAPSIQLGVNVVATQLVEETDSFGNDYDADATYPVIGQVDIYNAADFAKVKAGGIANLCADVTLTENVTLPADTVLRGNGYQINGTISAGGDLTIEGHVKVTNFSASYYDRTITIGEGACLEVTSTDRVSLAYGNTFNITGKLDNAKTTDKATVQPSLIIPGGISITGGNNAAMNVTNAYVQIGSTTSKNSAANGTFNLNFTNSIVDFTNQLTLSEPTNGMNPTFNINIKDSILTTGTKLCVAAPNSNVVIDNSTVVLGSNFRNSGNMTLKNGSSLTGATIQFGDNGGNDGITTIDNSTFTINATSTGHALDGKGTGKLVLQNGATATVDYYKALTVDVDTTSKFTGTKVQ